jgi:hypothetical protein
MTPALVYAGLKSARAIDFTSGLLGRFEYHRPDAIGLGLGVSGKRKLNH